jgi:hypothetical protein
MTDEVEAILALGLLVAVCFAGAGSAATHPTVAENKREAKLAAARLLALFVPPPRATRLRHEPLGDQGFLRTRSFTIGGQSVNKSGFWRVGDRLDSVVAFVRAHPPRGQSGREEAERAWATAFRPTTRSTLSSNDRLASAPPVGSR